jgi:GntR family transcriptional regulator
VQSIPSQGTFVVDSVNPFVTTLSAPADSGFGSGEGATYLSQVSDHHLSPRVSSPRVEVRVPPPRIALLLRIAPGEQVVSRHQERYIDQTPGRCRPPSTRMEFALHAPRLLMAGDLVQGATSYLEEVLGIKQVGYRDWITTRPPDANEQAFFGIGHDAGVFEILRTAFDATGRPLRMTVTVMPQDRNQFIVNVGKILDLQYEVTEPEHLAEESRPVSALGPSAADES